MSRAPERSSERSAEWTAAQRRTLFAGVGAFDCFVLVFVLSTPATSLHVKVVTAALAITSTLLVRPVGAVLCGPLAVLPGFVHQLGDVIASPGATLQASTASSRGGDHGLALAVVAGAVAVVIVVLRSSSRETRGRTSTGPAVAQHAGSSTA